MTQQFPTLLYRAQYIVDNTSTSDPSKMQFFAGFEMVGFVQKPKFVPIYEDGRLDCRSFWDHESATDALDELVGWYLTEGVRWGDKKPEHLGIIA